MNNTSSASDVVSEHFCVVFSSRTLRKVAFRRRISIRELIFTMEFHRLRLSLPLIASNVYWQWEQRELLLVIGLVLELGTSRSFHVFSSLLEFSISIDTKVR